METQKYIKTKGGNIIIFPQVVEHSTFKYLEPVSAGFCKIEGKSVVCYGESYSLNLKSIPGVDTETATLQLFGLEAMLSLKS